MSEGEKDLGVPGHIAVQCIGLANMLLDKNAAYGNSALEPLRICSQASTREQLLVRIDDKLSRIRTAAKHDAEDVWKDLLGYIVLLRVHDAALRRETVNRKVLDSQICTFVERLAASQAV